MASYLTGSAWKDAAAATDLLLLKSSSSREETKETQPASDQSPGILEQLWSAPSYLIYGNSEETKQQEGGTATTGISTSGSFEADESGGPPTSVITNGPATKQRGKRMKKDVSSSTRSVCSTTSSITTDSSLKSSRNSWKSWRGRSNKNLILDEDDGSIQASIDSRSRKQPSGRPKTPPAATSTEPQAKGEAASAAQATAPPPSKKQTKKQAKNAPAPQAAAPDPAPPPAARTEPAASKQQPQAHSTATASGAMKALQERVRIMERNLTAVQGELEKLQVAVVVSTEKVQKQEKDLIEVRQQMQNMLVLEQKANQAIADAKMPDTSKSKKAEETAKKAKAPTSDATKPAAQKKASKPSAKEIKQKKKDGSASVASRESQSNQSRSATQSQAAGEPTGRQPGLFAFGRKSTKRIVVPKEEEQSQQKSKGDNKADNKSRQEPVEQRSPVRSKRSLRSTQTPVKTGDDAEVHSSNNAQDNDSVRLSVLQEAAQRAQTVQKRRIMAFALQTVSAMALDSGPCRASD